MGGRNGFVDRLLVLAVLGGIQPSLAKAGDDAIEVRAISGKAQAAEAYDRDVDRAALSSQESAISKLAQLIHKYEGTRQEAVLLTKLAELQQQEAGILFRISHSIQAKKARADSTHDKAALAPYHKALESSIKTLDLLIAKYPHYEEMAHAYFNRGKAYEELEQKEAAARDYGMLVSHFQDAEETTLAYMSLAQFAIDANNHPLAINYLREVEKRPEDPHYPFALYKLGWSYYNLKNVPEALHYAEKQVAWYNDHAGAKEAEGEARSHLNVLSSDSAIRENTLVDVPIFYFDAVERKDDRYPVSKALAYFKKIESGPILGRMAERFAKLLRTRDMETELIAWKDQFLSEEPKRPEALDIVLITYEFLQNRREYAKVEGTAQDIVKLHKSGLKFDNLGKAQKMILDSAEGLQALIVKNKETNQAPALSRILVQMYASFTEIVDDSDPRVPQVHYNLAETLFTIKDYEGATTHYRWIVEHQTAKNKEVIKAVADSGVKAISSRYESLRSRGLIAKEVKARALPDKNAPRPALDPALVSWISWIDQESNKRSGREEGQASTLSNGFDGFVFEANRNLYEKGDIRMAVERLEKFARNHPSSDYAIPSASLVIDSYLESEDWDRVLELSRSFMQIKEWASGPFSARLYEVSADSYYKKIETQYSQAAQRPGNEQPQLYAAITDDIDLFLKNYGRSKRLADALSLGGSAALASNDKNRAMSYYGKIISGVKNDHRDPAGSSAKLTSALLARAAIEEDQDLFSEASRDYLSLIDLLREPKPSGVAATDGKWDAQKIDQTRRHLLVLAYLSAEPKILEEALSEKNICGGADAGKSDVLAADCEKYLALSALSKVDLEKPGSVPSQEQTERSFDRMRKTSNGNAKTLWAAYALIGAKHLAFRDRNLALRTLGSGYGDLDSISKFSLLPLLSATVPRAFHLNRLAMKDVAPLRADEKYITHRVDMIREMENAATKALDLPWARIRSALLNETGGLYLDLAKGLSELPSPKSMNAAEAADYNETVRHLSVPFEEKGQEIRSKAFEIASATGIEEDSFQEISNPFFSENPSQSAKLHKSRDAATPARIFPTGLKYIALGLGYAPSIERELGRDFERSNETRPLYEAWLKATEAKNWQQVAFFLQKARDRKLAGEAPLALMKAVSLAQAGARGEGLAELEEIRKNLPSDLKTSVTYTLALSYAQSFAVMKASELFAELAPPVPATAVAIERTPRALKSGP